MGPVKNSNKGMQANGYRMSVWLNENHELVSSGDDDFGWMGLVKQVKNTGCQFVIISPLKMGYA